MKDQIRISGKDLGQFGHPNFCPRCFWMKLKLNKLPVTIWPGIFSSIDAYTKRVIQGCFYERKEVPEYLLGVKEVTVVNSVVTALTTLSISKSI